MDSKQIINEAGQQTIVSIADKKCEEAHVVSKELVEFGAAEITIGGAEKRIIIISDREATELFYMLGRWLRKRGTISS